MSEIHAQPQLSVSVNTGPEVITIAAAKGGVGKTSVASELAYKLAVAGYRTLLVDGDPISQIAVRLDLERTNGTFRMFQPGNAPESYITVTERPNLLAVTGDKTTRVIKEIHTALGLEYQDLHALIPTRFNGDPIDYIVMDTPAEGYMQEIGVYLANTIVIPAGLDYQQAQGVHDIALSSVACAKQYHQNKRIIMLPFFNDRTKESKRRLKDLHEAYPEMLVYDPERDSDDPARIVTIPRRTQAREASAYGVTVTEYFDKLPKSERVALEPVLQAYSQLTAHILQMALFTIPANMLTAQPSQQIGEPAHA